MALQNFILIQQKTLHPICEEVEGRSPTRYELVSVKTLDTFFKENNIQYCNYLKMESSLCEKKKSC